MIPITTFYTWQDDYSRACKLMFLLNHICTVYICWVYENFKVFHGCIDWVLHHRLTSRTEQAGNQIITAWHVLFACSYKLCNECQSDLYKCLWARVRTQSTHATSSSIAIIRVQLNNNFYARKLWAKRVIKSPNLAITDLSQKSVQLIS